MKHMYITEEDIGNKVVCDSCGDDWTDRVESGGFLFGSYAYCPECASRSLPNIKAYGEMGYIKEYCPSGVSYKDWVLSLRNGNNTIKVTTTREE
jgi:hypothetical protein